MTADSTSTVLEATLKIAIIGSGPSAFYAAAELFKEVPCPLKVDMFERLPTPFGLLRGGVAPDHQNIKNLSKSYTRIAGNEGFRFFGNVNFGTDLKREDLLPRYDSIIYAVGCFNGRELNIPGGNEKGCYAATDFVGWYNGHPDYRNLKFDLSGKRIAVIGAGNVALDVARMFLRTPEDLEQTDMAGHALQTFKESKIEEVVLIARRGPSQASFTTVEIRELHELGVQTHVELKDLEEDAKLQEMIAKTPSSTARTNLKVLHKMQESTESKSSKSLRLLFCKSPNSIQSKNGQISSVTLTQNELVYDEDTGRVSAKATEEQETLDVGLLIHAIGYQAEPLSDVPFDAQRGVIPNVKGHVLEEGSPTAKEFVTGWIKRGPSGVIGSNKSDSIETVHCLLENLPEEFTASPSDDISELLDERNIEHVSFEDWKHLDAYEIEQGKLRGRPRHKICDPAEMLSVIKESA